jgi:hypothetical protein
MNEMAESLNIVNQVISKVIKHKMSRGFCESSYSTPTKHLKVNNKTSLIEAKRRILDPHTILKYTNPGH